jgi:hypothetical protein
MIKVTHHYVKKDRKHFIRVTAGKEVYDGPEFEYDEPAWHVTQGGKYIAFTTYFEGTCSVDIHKPYLVSEID